jgi:hypothetical protein
VLGGSAAAVGVGALVGVLLIAHANNDGSPNLAAAVSETPPTAQTSATVVIAGASKTTAPTGATARIFYVSAAGAKTTVHVFDTATTMDTESFNFGSGDDHPVTAGLSGIGVVTATQREVAYQSPDGSNRHVVATLAEGSRFNDMAVSSDGRMVAVISGTEGGNDGALAFIDIASNTTLLSIARTDPKFAAFGGYFFQVGWLGDGGGVLVMGGAGKEGFLNSATVLLDGSVRVHDMDGYQWYAPSRHAVAITHQQVSGFCAAGHELVLRDLDTEKVTNSVADPGKLFLPVQWAPDGSDVLFASWSTPAADCQRQGDRISYSLLPTKGGPAQPVSDLVALRRAWGLVYTVALDCPSEPNAVAFANWPQVTLSGPIRFGCGGSGSGKLATLKIGDLPIAAMPANATDGILLHGAN